MPGDQVDPSTDVSLHSASNNDEKLELILVGGAFRVPVDSSINLRPGIYRSAAAVDGGASSDLNVDGSVTPVEFNVVPNTGKIFFITEIALIMEDQAMNYTKFGGITGGLANGIGVEVKEGGETVRDIAIAGSIKTNAGFALAGGGIELSSSNTDLFVAIYNIVGKSKTSFKLVDSDGDFFRVTVNDDLRPIDNFKVIVYGHEVDE